MPSLTLKFKDKILEKFIVDPANTTAIGRRTSNDIVIVNLAASGYHAEIIPSEKGFILKDLDSKNGTQVNGKSLTSPVLLKDNDTITIARHMLVFKEKDPYPASDEYLETPETSILFEDPGELVDKTVFIDTETLSKIKSAKKTPSQGFIKLLSSGQEIPLYKQLTTIGKHSASDITIKGFLSFLTGGTAATVSRRPDGYYISTMDGILKPKVNNTPLKRVIKLKPLDEIRIGTFKMTFLLK